MWYHALILFYLIYSFDFDGVFFDVVERELSLLSRLLLSHLASSTILLQIKMDENN
jgi:hypothetical protein